MRIGRCREMKGEGLLLRERERERKREREKGVEEVWMVKQKGEQGLSTCLGKDKREERKKSII